MCGIALIVSGVRIDLSSLFPSHVLTANYSSDSAPVLVSIDDIKAALRKRGPDSLGSRSILLHVDEGRIIRFSVETEPTSEYGLTDNCVLNNGAVGKALFIGATLQLRGVYPITQPLVDKCGNIFVYNVDARRAALFQTMSFDQWKFAPSRFAAPFERESHHYVNRTVLDCMTNDLMDA